MFPAEAHHSGKGLKEGANSLTCTHHTHQLDVPSLSRLASINRHDAVERAVFAPKPRKPDAHNHGEQPRQPQETAEFRRLWCHHDRTLDDG